MKNLLKAEFYKARYNLLITITMIVSFVLAITINLSGEDNYILRQIDCMGFLFPILPSLIVGSIWATEYSEGTLRYIFINQNNKLLVFKTKVVCTFLLITFMFGVYVLGLLCSKPAYFLNSGHLVEYYAVPLLLLLNHSMILILVAVFCRSFSKMGLATVLLLLFYIFCYKMAIVYKNENIVLNIVANNTFVGIYTRSYSCNNLQSLFIHCIINFIVGLFCLLIAAYCLKETDV